MKAFGEAIAIGFGLFSIYVVAIAIAAIWIIFKFIKDPKGSLRMIRSIAIAVFVVIPLAFITKSWWFNLEDKAEISIVGLMVSLALVFTLTYALNKYFSKSEAERIE